MSSAVNFPAGSRPAARAVADGNRWTSGSSASATTTSGSTTTAAALPVLNGQSLTIRYGGVRAVKDVDLEVSAGELVGLIGPNGAGKTSLLDGISGFTPMSGRVQLGEHALEGIKPHVRAHRGLARTWQSHQLFDDLTVRENVEVAADRARWWSPLRDLLMGERARSDVAAQSLHRVGLSHSADRLPGELSHGQRALVGVARALAAEPTVLLMDEPAAGLDTEESADLGLVLRQIVADGLAIVLVEHDMALVRRVCDRVYVLNFGTVIATGHPEQVYRQPAVIAAYLGDDSAVRPRTPPRHADLPTGDSA